MAELQNVAQCFLYLDSTNEGDGISNLKLQKLVYYAQGFHIAMHGKHLFQEEIYAWPHGPVVTELYHKYKNCGNNPITPVHQFDSNLLTKDEFDVVEEVFEVFGQYSAWKLRNMTHEEKPWLDHEGDGGLISKIELMEYFKTRLN